MDELGFNLDPAFESGSISVGDLGLCKVRLQTDSRWPWLILIPARAGLREVEDLAPELRSVMLEEAVRAGAAVRALGEAVGFSVEKLNLGVLGNITPQLHLHVIGRRIGDPAWPGPVWGSGPALPYAPAALEAVLAASRKTLRLDS